VATAEQQVGENLTLSLSYISRVKTRLIEDVLYDPESGQEWAAADTPNNWWIPFNTIVPGAPGSQYEDTPVTVYFPSQEAPALFTRLNNVSQLKQKYYGWQLVARRKMADRWQFFGSLTLSKARGNVGLSHLATSAFTDLFNTPNALVNINRVQLLISTARSWPESWALTSSPGTCI